ncbi:MAG: hypothetical protein M1823_005826, partial [Watsoniomyces obsoletus]
MATVRRATVMEPTRIELELAITSLIDVPGSVRLGYQQIAALEHQLQLALDHRTHVSKDLLYKIVVCHSGLLSDEVQWGLLEKALRLDVEVFISPIQWDMVPEASLRQDDKLLSALFRQLAQAAVDSNHHTGEQQAQFQNILLLLVDGLTTVDNIHELFRAWLQALILIEESGEDEIDLLPLPRPPVVTFMDNHCVFSALRRVMEQRFPAERIAHELSCYITSIEINQSFVILNELPERCAAGIIVDAIISALHQPATIDLLRPLAIKVHDLTVQAMAGPYWGAAKDWRLWRRLRLLYTVWPRILKDLVEADADKEWDRVAFTLIKKSEWTYRLDAKSFSRLDINLSMYEALNLMLAVVDTAINYRLGRLEEIMKGFQEMTQATLRFITDTLTDCANVHWNGTMADMTSKPKLAIALASCLFIQYPAALPRLYPSYRRDLFPAIRQAAMAASNGLGSGLSIRQVWDGIVESSNFLGNNQPTYDTVLTGPHSNGTYEGDSSAAALQRQMMESKARIAEMERELEMVLGGGRPEDILGRFNSMLVEADDFTRAKVTALIESQTRLLGDQRKSKLLEIMVENVHDTGRLLWLRIVLNSSGVEPFIEDHELMRRLYRVLCREMQTETDPRRNRLMFDCMLKMVLNHRWVLSQFEIEGTLGCIIVMTSPRAPALPTIHASLIYGNICRLMDAILTARRQHLRRRMQTILAVTRNLLQCLYPFSKDHPPWLSRTQLSIKDGESFSRLLDTLCDPTASSVNHHGNRQLKLQLTSATNQAQQVVGQHLPYLLAYYVELQRRSPMSSDIHRVVKKGLYAVIRS